MGRSHLLRCDRIHPAAINEEMFADELRFKEYATSIEHINGTGMFIIDYESQGWDEAGLKDFYLEVKRCLKAIGFYGNVKIHIWERGYKDSGECEQICMFTIKQD